MKNVKLRIAQLGTVWETTPPELYGGTERVVSLLTEELVDRGHDVTLFATGDSKTKAKLVSAAPMALYRLNIPWSNVTFPLLHIYQAYKRKDEFDIFHAHLNMPTDYMALMLSKLLNVPTIYTMHFCLPTETGQISGSAKFLREFSKSNYVSISDSQRTMNKLNFVGTVYNGIDIGKYQYNSKGGEGLIWLGRFSPNKGPVEAIQIAQRCNKKLLMAGKKETQEKKDKEFYINEVDPLLKKSKKTVSYFGEANDKNKNDILGNSKCLVNPISWREPFGLVVAEANACGTPVVAFDQGSMREIIKEGVNGFVVQAGDIGKFTERVNYIYNMSANEYENLRKSSRKYAEDNFSHKRMTDDYEKIYYQIAKK